MVQTWRKALHHQRLQTPLAILSETYRPLALFAGELFIAAEPFLPDSLARWVQNLIDSDTPFQREDT